jgi:hypothetical protein
MYTNGSIWKSKYPFCAMAVLVYLGLDSWCLFSIDDTGILQIISDPDAVGKLAYCTIDIPERLKDWESVPDARLGITYG